MSRLFRVHQLAAALLSSGLLSTSALAVNVNADGLGQALVFPYYTVGQAKGSNFNTLLSVVNSTDDAKAVKVRFTEGRNSREVLDWNLFLSPRDVWTAIVVPTAANGAAVATPDLSCTLPLVSREISHPNPFVNYAYAGDGGGDGLERTQEGYVEVIEMGTLVGASAAAVTHVNGVPPCNLPDTAGIQADTRPPTGGLTGTVTLINVLQGQDFIVEPVALDNFRAQGVYDHPGTIKPELADADPISVVYDRNRLVVSRWPRGFDAVSAVLMRNTVVNEYMLDVAILGMTEWVVTFPTKRYYVDTANGPAGLFQRPFGAEGSCDDVTLALLDREERLLLSDSGGFSPPPPSGHGAALCWEANVVRFGDSNIFGSRNSAVVQPAFPAGWGKLGLAPLPGMPAGVHQLIGTDNRVVDATGATTTPATVVYTGLPVVGFMARSYSNGTLVNQGQPVWANYSGTSVHRFTKDIR